MPVLHQGYVQFLAAHPNITEVYLPGEALIRELTFLEPEIRAVDPSLMAKVLRSSGLAAGVHVQVMEPKHMPDLSRAHIITADEGFSRRLVERYFAQVPVTYDTIFLRWDEVSVFKTEPAGYDRISSERGDRERMVLAESHRDKSGDWWRQIGGGLYLGAGVVISGFNRHVPSQLAPYAQGDPRDVVPAGTDAQISTAMHCEMYLITEAAKQGASTAGGWMYVTVFPCPVCAKLLAYSGISKVFFRNGHASLDGQQVLKANGVEIVWVPEDETISST